MITKRRVSIAIISISFASAIFAGVFLALADLSMANLLNRASVVFVIITPLLIFGIYLYVNSAPPEPIHSETEQQLQLVDLLNTEGVVSVQAAALHLNIDPERILDLLDDLRSLRLFAGHVDTATGIIYASHEDQPRLSS